MGFFCRHRLFLGKHEKQRENIEGVDENVLEPYPAWSVGWFLQSAENVLGKMTLLINFTHSFLSTSLLAFIRDQRLELSVIYFVTFKLSGPAFIKCKEFSENSFPYFFLFFLQLCNF